jgi:hypothetical protein
MNCCGNRRVEFSARECRDTRLPVKSLRNESIALF